MASQFDDPAGSSKLPSGATPESATDPPDYNDNSQSAPKSSGQRDQKAAYALSLQRACDAAVQRVKNNNIVANSNWASPLAAAPSAISTMAILLKTAEMKAAAGLEIESQEVKNEEGAVVGTLPSKYFHTNLQHCSDIGRLAFLDAQHGMNTIRATARGMIAEEGAIAYIIDLLEDAEDARYNLKPEINAIRGTAKKCLQQAEAITSKFQYWHLVICHLRQTSLTKRGQVIKEKEDTSDKKSGAEADEVKYKETKISLEEEIESLKRRLDMAERNVERAQTDVDRLKWAPLAPEPSAWEEIERVRRIIPNTSPQMRERGLLVNLKDGIFGQSREHEAQDAAIRKSHAEHVQKLIDNAMQRAKEQREYQRKLATDNLNAAQLKEKKTVDDLNAALGELHASNYQLAEAKANLSRTKSELNRLANKELELTGIMDILDESTRQLGKLKEQIEPLVDFFKNILTDIENNVEENLEAFLRPIVQGITQGSSPDEVEAIRISRRSKDRILTTALQMQGRFSAITDISTAYITISTDYIRPAINKMESLSTVSDSEWQIRSKEFFQWCESSMNDIDNVARTTNANVQQNIARHINSLHRRAIEAASENDNH